jgi:hypothetical protein
MSIRTDDTGKGDAAIQQGNSIPDDFDVPNCTIEDVDRSVFELFNKQLPFTYHHKQGTRRAPVIFATGERFAVLRRKEPLRDRSGALILPLVSIMRAGVTQAPSMGAGTNQNADLTIKKRLSPKDPLYQRLINKHAIVNSDNLVSPSAKATDITGSLAGRIASRRPGRPRTSDSVHGRLLETDLGKNIFEIITLPPPKYYTTTYEVTFWSQYTVQMNDMIMGLMTLYQSYSQRTFRLETPKGYWFVGYIDEDLSPGNNFDDFTDSERLVRYSFNITVPAYIIGAAFSSSQNVLRKYVSAPDISFNSDILTINNFANTPPSNIPSGDTNDYVLDDMRTVDDPLPGQAIGHAGSMHPVKSLPVANVGGAESDSDIQILKIEYNPFTGEPNATRVFVKSRIRRSGETVLKEDILSIAD